MMKSRVSWGIAVVGVLLVVAVLAGFYASSDSNHVMTEESVTVETCGALPDYDFERMVSRVERIKGTQLKRNLTMCTEQRSGGIDTTPNREGFARIEKSGLSFFGLDADTNTQRRSSLGHTTFSPSGGPIEIFLANESVVESVTWISYEGLVVHELSDAIEIPPRAADRSATSRQGAMPQTTDEILARQALSNGVSLYVSDLYVEAYGGQLNVTALNVGDRNWKRQLIQSVYYSGYRYSSETDRRTIPETNRPNSTAQILHPNETVRVNGFPKRPNLSMDSLERVRTDRIGELFLRETLRSKGVSEARAAAAAGGWTNDRMDYYRANKSTVVSWRVTWQNAEEMAEFVETYDAVYDYERVNAARSVTCEERSRYLSTSEKTMTVVLCSA